MNDYHTDPTWQQAQQTFIDPGAESSDLRMVTSIKAAVAMWEVESATAPLSDGQRDRIASLLRSGGVA